MFWTGGRLWEVVSHGLCKKCDATKIPLCEIMGLVSISRKYKMRKSLAKNQPVSAN